MQGAWPDIVSSSLLYAIGSVSLAIALQGSAPIGGRISTAPRVLFGLSAILLLFPSSWIMDLAGLVAGVMAILSASMFRASSGISAKTEGSGREGG